MAHAFIDSIRAEYRRYEQLGRSAIAQVPDHELCAVGPRGSHSIATVCWHLAGNFRSRFTDFLTSDGEKPWRQREAEFAPRVVSRVDLLAEWDAGWTTVLDAIDRLSDHDLTREVTIRGQALQVQQALHRSLAHAAYHVGQIVYVAKAIRGSAWQFLSIPPGQSAAYATRPFDGPPVREGATGRGRGGRGDERRDGGT